MLATPLVALGKNEAPPYNRLEQSFSQNVWLVAIHVSVENVIDVIGVAKEEKGMTELFV